MSRVKENVQKSAWRPRVDALPVIVKENLFRKLSSEEKMRRLQIVKYALMRMVRDGEALAHTVILRHQGRTPGELIEKPFTFFKLKNAGDRGPQSKTQQ